MINPHLFHRWCNHSLSSFLMLYKAQQTFTSSHNKNQLCFKEMKRAVGFGRGRYSKSDYQPAILFLLLRLYQRLKGKGGDRREWAHMVFLACCVSCLKLCVLTLYLSPHHLSLSVSQSLCLSVSLSLSLSVNFVSMPARSVMFDMPCPNYVDLWFCDPSSQFI
jgi:hypothetical protein